MNWQFFLVVFAFVVFVAFFVFSLYKAYSSQFDGMIRFYELEEEFEKKRRSQILHTDYKGERKEISVGDLEDLERNGFTTMVNEKGELCFARPEDNPSFKEAELLWLPENAHIIEENDNQTARTIPVRVDR